MTGHGEGGDSDVYQPQDSLYAGVKGTAVVGGAGLFLSAIQNSLQKRNVGAWGVLTRTGGTVASFGEFSGMMMDANAFFFFGLSVFLSADRLFSSCCSCCRWCF